MAACTACVACRAFSSLSACKTLPTATSILYSVQLANLRSDFLDPLRVERPSICVQILLASHSDINMQISKIRRRSLRSRADAAARLPKPDQIQSIIRDQDLAQDYTASGAVECVPHLADAAGMSRPVIKHRPRSCSRSKDKGQIRSLQGRLEPQRILGASFALLRRFAPTCGTKQTGPLTVGQ